MQKIVDLKKYLSNVIDGEKVYKFLCSLDDNTPKGRHDINENVYVNVVSYETKESFDGVFESHRDFIDLHVLISGEEKIYYGDKKTMTIVKKYDKSDDYELLKGETYSCVNCSKMQGVEFLANEPHMAAIAINSPKKVLKAVVKMN